MGRQTSIAAVPGTVTASMHPNFSARSGSRMMPSVSRRTLCKNEIAPAISYPAPEMTPGAIVYQPKPAAMASPSRRLSGESSA